MRNSTDERWECVGVWVWLCWSRDLLCDLEDDRKLCDLYTDVWKWQHTPVFLSGESHRQRSLVGYNPWNHKDSDMTEVMHEHV